MSGEASLRHKLNKQLKLASGRSKNYKDGYKKVESTLNNDGKGKFKPMNSDRRMLKFMLTYTKGQNDIWII